MHRADHRRTVDRHRRRGAGYHGSVRRRWIHDEVVQRGFGESVLYTEVPERIALLVPWSLIEVIIPDEHCAHPWPVGARPLESSHEIVCLLLLIKDKVPIRRLAGGAFGAWV